MKTSATTSVLAAALIISPGARAAAPDAGCLAQADFATIGTAVLPTILNGVADRCRSKLPGDAALLRRDDDRWQALTAAATDARPAATIMAKTLVARAKTPFPVELAATDDILDVGAAFVSSALPTDLKAGDCAGLDRAYVDLAPLPPANLFRLVSLILMSGKKPLVCPLDEMGG